MGVLTQALVGCAVAVPLALVVPGGLQAAEAVPTDPHLAGQCTYQIEPETHRELVVETDVKGTITIWHKGKEWRTFNSPANNVEYFNLKKRHKDASHFQVAVIKNGTRHNHEVVWWCEPA